MRVVALLALTLALACAQPTAPDAVALKPVHAAAKAGPEFGWSCTASHTCTFTHTQTNGTVDSWMWALYAGTTEASGAIASSPFGFARFPTFTYTYAAAGTYLVRLTEAYKLHDPQNGGTLPTASSDSLITVP